MSLKFITSAYQQAHHQALAVFSVYFGCAGVYKMYSAYKANRAPKTVAPAPTKDEFAELLKNPEIKALLESSK